MSSIQLYYKLSYLSILILLVSFFLEIITGYVLSIKHLEESIDISSLRDDIHIDIYNIAPSNFSIILTTLKLLGKKFSPEEIQILKQKIKNDNEGSDILNFNYSIKVDHLNLHSGLWKVFIFFCLPTLITESLIFLPLFIIFKILPPFSEYLKVMWNILSFLLLFQICFWGHEFGHVFVTHLVKGVEYVVKTPFKYKCLEVCLAGGILTKFEFRFERFGKRLWCPIAGPFVNLMLAFIFLIPYFYTNITLFYIGFMMNIVMFYIHLLPVTVEGISFDGKNFVQELALFRMSKRYKKIDFFI
ncbi:MAG: hypothetical protein AB1414_12110 [bacterium]